MILGLVVGLVMILMKWGGKVTQCRELKVRVMLSRHSTCRYLSCDSLLLSHQNPVPDFVSPC